MSDKQGYRKVIIAGVSFQAGSAAVDSATIMSALVYQLSGSSVLVGAVTAILRFGWLFPQLFVGFLAQNAASSMPFYIIGAFGRAICIGLIALVLALGADLSHIALVTVVMVLWVAYAFISGIVAVPYNDIVARTVPSARRSTMLATRFFGGGVLALGVAWIADKAVGAWDFPASFAAIFAMASGLMLVSSFVFTSIGEPEQVRISAQKPGFFAYLRAGVTVFRDNKTFRLFVYAQWMGGVVLMAMPFYVVEANLVGFSLGRVALLLGAQTFGALLSNFLWGWWGDHLGKASLLRAIAFGRIIPPLVIVFLVMTGLPAPTSTLPVFIAIFMGLGALANGLTIAVIGFLMEISPDDLRPSYSGYFNALTAPAFLLPLLAGVLAVWSGLTLIFAISAVAALVQFIILMRIKTGAG
ncbi:MAG: MFS transporter [Alphaproteobacteria bacterium]|nr:MFS transporter [Alphaproteobacteria bacterium]